MHEFNILMELRAPDGQIAKGNQITVANKIKNFIVVIQFPKGEKPTNAKITNIDKYGWGGIVANNYQEAERILCEKIKENGKLKNIILHSHGGVITVKDYLGNSQAKKEFISSSHLDDRHIRADHFTMQKRINEEIPKEENEKAEYYERRENERKKRADRRELNKQIREGNANLSKEEINKLKKEKKWKNKDNNSNGYYDDLREKEEDRLEKESDDKEYENFKTSISNEKKKINSTVTPEIKEDIKSLKSMISCVEDGGNFIFAACNSAYYTNTIQEIRKFINLQVNLVGIVLLANYYTKEGTEGELDGDILFSSRIKAFLVKDSEGNKAILISPSGTVTEFNNIKIEIDGPQFIK